MTACNSTPKVRGISAAILAPDADIDQRPIDVIHDRLSQARATIDLIYTLAITGRDRTETLCAGTLGTAMYGAMLRIDEAIEASQSMAAAHV